MVVVKTNQTFGAMPCGYCALRGLMLGLVMIFSPIAHGQPEEAKQRNGFSMPILQECKDTTIKYLENEKKNHVLQYRYSSFDAVLDSHKSLIGYVLITPRYEDDESEKKTIMNIIISACYPDTTVSIDRKKKDWGGEFQDIISNMEKKNNKLYIEMDKNDLNIYYNFGQFHNRGTR
jgi:hypothetical protein